MRKSLIGLLGYTFVSQQMAAQTDSVADTRELKAVVVKATNGIKSRFRVDNTEIIGQGQLIRAACCMDRGTTQTTCSDAPSMMSPRRTDMRS